MRLPPHPHPPIALPRLCPACAACRSSDGVHEVALGGIEKDSELAGMDQEVFAAAPPAAMRKLLQVRRGWRGGWGGWGWERGRAHVSSRSASQDADPRCPAHSSQLAPRSSPALPNASNPTPPLLQYLDYRYGGARRYMEAIGFGADQQAQLAAGLMQGDW